MQKRSSITVRLTEQDKVKIKKNAIRAGISESEYVRRAAVNRNVRIRKASQDQVRTIVQIQIAMQEIKNEIRKTEPNLRKIEEKIENVGELSDLWKL